MTQSLYPEYVQKYMPQLVLSIVERLNEKRVNQLPYLFRTLLTPTFSADARWASILADYNRVAADVVALDSELPLKSRDTIEMASGDIPKIGMKLPLTEKQMKDLDAMIAQNMPINRIVQTIFNSLPRCIEGVYERIEDMFLSGLSTGVALSAKNNGTGARVDYGYLAANNFITSKSWDDPTAPILDDIQKIFDKCVEDANVPTDLYLDDYALRNIYKNNQVRAQFAFNMNFVGQNVPVLDLDQTNLVFQRKWGVNVHRVARKIKTEINGKKSNHSPWAEGRLVFTCNATLGDLVWTTVAEATRPVSGVTYQSADEYILLSQYSKNDPLTEITASQAMVVPVINNVDQIYTLDSKTVAQTSNSGASADTPTV